MESRILKRNPEPAKKIARPEVQSETVKPVPASDTGVGGSSLDSLFNRDDECSIKLS